MVYVQMFTPSSSPALLTPALPRPRDPPGTDMPQSVCFTSCPPSSCVYAVLAAQISPVCVFHPLSSLQLCVRGAGRSDIPSLCVSPPVPPSSCVYAVLAAQISPVCVFHLLSSLQLCVRGAGRSDIPSLCVSPPVPPSSCVYAVLAAQISPVCVFHPLSLLPVVCTRCWPLRYPQSVCFTPCPSLQLCVRGAGRSDIPSLCVSPPVLPPAVCTRCWPLRYPQSVCFTSCPPSSCVYAVLAAQISPVCVFDLLSSLQLCVRGAGRSDIPSLCVSPPVLPPAVCTRCWPLRYPQSVCFTSCPPSSCVYAVLAAQISPVCVFHLLSLPPAVCTRCWPLRYPQSVCFTSCPPSSCVYAVLAAQISPVCVFHLLSLPPAVCTRCWPLRYPQSVCFTSCPSLQLCVRGAGRSDIPSLCVSPPVPPSSCVYAVLAAQMGAGRVYVLESSRITRRALEMYCRENDADDIVQFVDPESAATAVCGPVDVLFGEPFFYGSVLPWHDLHFWYRARQLAALCSENTRVRHGEGEGGGGAGAGRTERGGCG